MSGSRYRRRTAFRLSKPTVVIATEGERTEPIYFEELKRRHREVVTVIVSAGKPGESNPMRVLKRLRQAISKRAAWTNRDSAWLAVDSDSWTSEELNEIIRELRESGDFQLAASNPCFELWLLLHFRDAWEGATADNLISRLADAVCLGSYAKETYDAVRMMGSIGDAIERAARADSGPLDQWPAPGTTRVYRLVDLIYHAGGLSNEAVGALRHR